MNNLNLYLRTIPVLESLRQNLEFITSTQHDSVVDTGDHNEGHDLGLVGVSKGVKQVVVHNSCVLLIWMASMGQCLRNYQELKALMPWLEDPDIESFLDSLGDQKRFLAGLSRMRNTVYHVKLPQAWRHPDIQFVNRVFEEYDGGYHAMIRDLGKLLSEFFGKCVTGRLKLWPPEVEECWDLEARKRGMTLDEMITKIQLGEIDALGYLEIQDGVMESFIKLWESRSALEPPT